MPGNIIPIQPTVTFPYGLSTAFMEQTRFEALINLYLDGHSTRQALTIGPRRRFTMTKPLTAAAWSQLRQFYYDHLLDTFWFYNLRETVPPFTWDPTGGSPFGRYAVVFDGPWADTLGLGRSSAQLALREVDYAFTVAAEGS